MYDRIKLLSLHARQLSPLEKAHHRKEITQVHIATAEGNTTIHLWSLTDFLYIEITEEKDKTLENQRGIHQVKRHLILQQIYMVKKGKYDGEHCL